jgi:hypothetical protein
MRLGWRDPIAPKACVECGALIKGAGTCRSSTIASRVTTNWSESMRAFFPSSYTSLQQSNDCGALVQSQSSMPELLNLPALIYCHQIEYFLFILQIARSANAMKLELRQSQLQSRAMQSDSCPTSYPQSSVYPCQPHVSNSIYLCLRQAV